MEELINCIIKNNIKYFVFKFFTFISLIFIWYPKDDVGIFTNLLEYKYVQDITMNINYSRLLAKHELKQELKYAVLGEKLSEGNINKGKKYIAQNVSKYSELKGVKSNNFNTYMNGYRNRYAKKNGLFKLECYCEKQVLDNIHHIYEFAETMKSDKKRLKRTFYKKYGKHLIILSLIPALGFIFPILFGGEEPGSGIIKYCFNKDHSEGKGNCTRNYQWYENKNIIESIGIVNYIFYFIIGVIVLLAFIYILMKVIKYESLKAGRGKMNRKEYIDFCKKLLKNEKY